MESISNLLSEKQAAEFLGVSFITLFRKRKRREIGCYRVGFRVLYSREKHLQPFLDACEQKACIEINEVA